MFGHFVSDLMQVWIQGCPKISRLEVSGLLADSGQIQLERYGQRLDLGQIPFPDGFWQCVLICQAFKILAQVLHVAPVRCGGDAQNVSILEMFQDFEIAV